MLILSGQRSSTLVIVLDCCFDTCLYVYTYMYYTPQILKTPPMEPVMYVYSFIVLNYMRLIVFIIL